MCYRGTGVLRPLKFIWGLLLNRTQSAAVSIDIPEDLTLQLIPIGRSLFLSIYSHRKVAVSATSNGIGMPWGYPKHVLKFNVQYNCNYRSNWGQRERNATQNTWSSMYIMSIEPRWFVLPAYRCQ